jgi:hypothetical protein
VAGGGSSPSSPAPVENPAAIRLSGRRSKRLRQSDLVWATDDSDEPFTPRRNLQTRRGGTKRRRESEPEADRRSAARRQPKGRAIASRKVMREDGDSDGFSAIGSRGRSRRERKPPLRYVPG